MHPRPHRIRRGRRTDFVPVMELLATSGVPVPPADRATLRRFRRLVADLGSDLYLAVIDERTVGIVHATYTRQLLDGAQARIELLVVTPTARHQGIGSALASFIGARARKRGCLQLSCAFTNPDSLAFFTALGWHAGCGVCSTELAAASAADET